MIFWLTDKNLIFVSGCLSSVDISAPQLRLWSLRLAWFLHHPQLQLLDPSVWSSDWPMDSVMSRVVLKVSVRKVLCVVGLFWQWLCNQPIFLFVQPRWPTAPFMQILITLSQRCSGILCTLRSEYWRGLIPTLSWLLEDAGQLLTPTLTVFLSGTCWLMGKSECWSDLRDKHVWAFKKKKMLYSTPLPPVSSFLRCPYRDDRYLTALVPVDASSGLACPTHHRRFIFKMFTFVATGAANPSKGGAADPEVMTPLKEKV